MHKNFGLCALKSACMLQRLSDKALYIYPPVAFDNINMMGKCEAVWRSTFREILLKDDLDFSLCPCHRD